MHTCGECGREFTRATILREHMTIHTGEHPHICGVCGAGYRHAGNLKRHVMKHAETEVEQILIKPVVEQILIKPEAFDSP